MGTPRVVTAIALFAGVRLAALDHLIAVTVRIHHRLVSIASSYGRQTYMTHCQAKIQIYNTTCD